MKNNKPLIKILVLFAIGLSSCAAPVAPENPVTNSANPTVENEAMPEQPASNPSETSPEAAFPTWFSQELKDVTTGKVFKVIDFKEKVILVETMAVWCPKCLTQQQEVAKLKSLLEGRDDFVSIGIDIDPNENEALLSSHVKKYEFDWIFAIASKTVIDEIGALYGAQFLNPPATPMLIIDKQGRQHPLSFGIKSVEELQKALQPFLDSE